MRIMIRTSRKVTISHFSSKEFCESFREYRFIVSNATVATSGIDGTFDCDPEIPLASHDHPLRFLHTARIFSVPNFRIRPEYCVEYRF